MLRVEIQARQESVTLRCSGRIVLGLEAEALRCMATSRKEQLLMLDLANVGAVDAAGLGLLVELQGWARQHNRVLRILNPSAGVRRIIALTWLYLVLSIAESSDAGLDWESDSGFRQRAMTA